MARRLVFALLLMVLIPGAAAAGIERVEHRVEAEPGVTLSLLQVTARDARRADPVILIHGARVPGRARFDLPDATHYLHLDRPEHGRARFVDAVLAFLSAAY